jgi:uncharacterized oxidoreductase
MRLQSRKVVITGGSSGIGMAIATELTARGNNVVLVARNAERLRGAQEQLPGSSIIVANIATQDGQRTIVDQVATQHPDVSIIINSAGVLKFSDLAKPDSFLDLREQLETNFVGLVALSLEFAGLLRPMPEGAIVNISSGLAYLPSARMAYYSATKAAVHSFTQSLRYQLRDTNIRVIELLPPAVDTPMLTGVQRPKMPADVVANALLDGIEREKTEIRLGGAARIYAMSRLFPRFAFRRINPAR